MQISEVMMLLGGLGLFLYGMKLMGDGLEMAAGSRLKRSWKSSPGISTWVRWSV